MAKTDTKNDAKGKKDKTKGKKKAKGADGAAGADGISVAAHPRAAAQVRRAKGFGGVGFFAIAAYLSYKANVPPDQVALRALAVGVAGYMLAWACSVSIMRQLVLAELRAAVDRRQADLSPPAARVPVPPTAGSAGAGGE